MTIFDSIRYPITKNFIVEDLNRIPYAIRSVWWHRDILTIPRLRRLVASYSEDPIDIHESLVTMNQKDFDIFHPYYYETLVKRILLHDTE